MMFTPLKYLQGNHEKIMRDRLLSLPVMVALMVSIVYRQIAGLSEAVRVLKEEGLLWIEPLKVTKQAVSKRIMNVPAEIFAILQPFAYLRRTITAVGKIIAEMNRRAQIFNRHSQQSLYYNLRLRHKTADKSF